MWGARGGMTVHDMVVYIGVTQWSLTRGRSDEQRCGAIGGVKAIFSEVISQSRT